MKIVPVLGRRDCLQGRSEVDYRLQDLIDIERFQQLQDRLNAIYSFPSAIIDNEGTVLTATAWQEVCTRFHRVHPVCRTECVKSDRYILEHLHEASPAVSYRCPHGLVDNALPIIIEGVHYGNFFTGQFFLEPPDLEFFRSQARRYGFDEAAYLEAVRKVPVWTQRQLSDYLLFIKELIEVISGIGLRHLRVIETERALRESQVTLAGILNSVPQSIFWKDANGVYLGCNKNFAQAVGLSDPGLIAGKTDYDLPWPRAEAEAYRADDREVVAGNVPKRRILEPLQTSDGRRLRIETTKVPLRDGSGAPYAVLGVYEDITERHLLEEERRTIEKLESIGTLAGGIAHDFNNLLQGVFGYISLAKRSTGDEAACLTLLERAETALHVAVGLTTQLLTFSKGGAPDRKRMALGPVIESAAKFALSGSRVTCEVRAGEALWAVDADAGQLVQMIQNLVLNADQAMPDGGKVTISARNVAVPHPDLPPALAEGAYVEIAVGDTGVGIPASELPRIFDPYFTTKEKGSGLGLATCYSIVRNHGGTITARSDPGRGSTFFVHLPAIAGAMATAEAPVAAASAVRSARILLVDDEQVVREVGCAMIRSLGHEVEAAEEGAAAVERYRQALAEGRKFDVVILDLTIRGGLGGREAMQRLRQIDPEVRSVVSSGYAEGSAACDFRADGFRATLKKPYNLSRLNATLNELLA